MKHNFLGIRWTIGDVSGPGFESLALSIRSAQRLFGPAARYAVCVNSIPLSEARERLGPVGNGAQWIHAASHIPAWLQRRLDDGMAEGVAWKLAPVRFFPDHYELSLDNDVVLWQVPHAIRLWLASSDPESCLMAEDAQRSLGQFSSYCDDRPINSGIRGVPPGFDLEGRLRRTLEETAIVLRSELDEQGLQAAVLSQAKLSLVSRDDVSICSPFPMHQSNLGRCGAHFVGLNQKQLPWELEGRGAHEVIHERWRNYRGQLHRLVEDIIPYRESGHYTNPIV